MSSSFGESDSMDSLGLRSGERPFPEDYIRFGLPCCRSAIMLLDNSLNDKKSNLSISIGLSLHALELFGKSILRAFDTPPTSIRSNYRQHNLLDLLRNAQDLVLDSEGTRALKQSEFLEYRPESDNWKASFSIEAALHSLLNEEKTISPREYLYPDRAEYSALEPYSALPIMSDYLGRAAVEIAAVRGWIKQ